MSELISRQAAVDAIEEVDWYHQNENKDMVSGANSTEHQAWYKEDDIYKTLEALPTVEAIPIKWLCDYAVIIAENNYEQAKFIFRLIENYKSELNEDKDKAAIDNLKRMKENWLKNDNGSRK